MPRKRRHDNRQTPDTLTSLGTVSADCSADCPVEIREAIDEAEHAEGADRSALVSDGKDLTMVAYGSMLRPTLSAAQRLADADGIAAEVIDLLTISPLNDRRFSESARRTGRVVIVQAAQRSFGVGAEIVARLVEKAFWYLEAPVVRVAGYDVQMPYSAREGHLMPD
jgi:pyruvate dehydrogenase E1 component beta subunit